MGKSKESLVGKVFGRLTVLRYIENDKRGNKIWECQCSCENKTIIQVSTGDLNRKESKRKIESCGCIKKENKKPRKISQKRIDRINSIVGETFNKWTVLAFDKINKSRKMMFKCQCQCEKKTIKSIEMYSLLNGASTSCGCVQKETTQNNVKHGCSRKHKKDRLYEIWTGMKKRCYNKNNTSHKDYGGRGIIIYNEWIDKENGFINFKNWAMENGYEETLTIDRINVNGNYEPSNCRWITMTEQTYNKRTSVFIEIEGVIKGLHEWSKETGISNSTISHRYKRGIRGKDLLCKGVIPKTIK